VEAMQISDEQAAMQPLGVSGHESETRTTMRRRKPRKTAD
jgi:hypothetical protein